MSHEEVHDEFIAEDVTPNRPDETRGENGAPRRMLVREHRKIGRGAFGTVVQAYLTQDEQTWYGPFAIKKLAIKHVKLYSYQIARGMLYLHALGICHRDIKPSNILVDPKTGVLKICDFGSAKRLEPNQPSISYICSRFYRAPELILGSTQYTTQVDIWGLGCVIGEMLIGRAIFQGQDPLLQLREIAKLLGPPDKKFIFFSNPRYTGPLYSTPLFNGTSLERFQKYFGHAGPDVY
ncbi:Serine/Threonine protein kinases active-site signature [Nakaseomyces glabratus]|nr:Serine/Threonine protein kinases active-site signature [Nakaseomyces glabratus]